MGSYRPGTEAANWIEQHWDSEIGITAYQEAVGYPKFKRFEGKPGKQWNFRKHANLTTQSPADTVVLGGTTALTYSSSTEAVVTSTPSTRYCAVEVDDNVLWRMQTDPMDTFRKSVDMSVTEKVDNVAMALFASLTTSSVGGAAANIDKSLVLEAQRKLVVAGKMYIKIGQTPMHFIVSHQQTDKLGAITDFMSAQVRGDSRNPMVTGWLFESLGMRFYESGNLTSDGNGTHGCLFVDDTFGIGWNKPINVKLQEIELVQRIIASCDFAVIERFDELGVDVQTIN